MFTWPISHQPAILFSQNKPATSNQPALLLSQNKSVSATSQTNMLLVGKSEYKYHTLGVWVFEFAQQDGKRGE
jgi:hypothetical protein